MAEEKIATYKWCNAQFGSSGTSNECPTKSEIIAMGLLVKNETYYSSNQLVKQVDIGQASWTYSFSVSNWDKNVAATGGTTSAITVTSSKTRNGETVDVGWGLDSSSLPSWVTYNESDMTFTVAANTGESSRSVQIYFQQSESGNRDYARITQAAASVSYNYYFSLTSTTMEFTATGVGQSKAITTYRKKVVNGVETGSAEAVSFTISGTPSWMTAEKATVNNTTTNLVVTPTNNTSTSSRGATLTLTQLESNKTLEIYVTQSAAGTTSNYYLSIDRDMVEIDGLAQSLVVKATSYREDFVNGVSVGTTPLLPTVTKESFTGDSTDWVTWGTPTISGNVYTYTLSISENSAYDRMMSIEFRNAGAYAGMTLTQHELNLTWEYFFQPEVTESFQASQGATDTGTSLTWRSYKVGKDDNGDIIKTVDVPFTATLDSTVDWVTATVDEATFSVRLQFTQNLDVNIRSVGITYNQLESNKKITGIVTQLAYSWTYTFHEDSNRASFPVEGYSGSWYVTSYREGRFPAGSGGDTTTVQVVVGVPVDVRVTDIITMSYVGIDTTESGLPARPSAKFSLVMPANTGPSRSTTAYFTQRESNKTLNEIFAQEGTGPKTLTGTFGNGASSGTIYELSAYTASHTYVSGQSVGAGGMMQIEPAATEELIFDVYLDTDTDYDIMLTGISINGSITPKMEDSVVPTNGGYAQFNWATQASLTTYVNDGVIELSGVIDSPYANVDPGAQMAKGTITWYGDCAGAPQVTINIYKKKSKIVVGNVGNIQGATAYVGTNNMSPTVKIEAGKGYYIGIEGDGETDSTVYADYGYPGSGQSSQVFGFTNVRVGGDRGSDSGRLAKMVTSFDSSADYIIQSTIYSKNAVSFNPRVMGNGVLYLDASRNSGTYPSSGTHLALIKLISNGPWPTIWLNLWAK